jgi:hypothetical protein
MAGHRMAGCFERSRILPLLLVLGLTLLTRSTFKTAAESSDNLVIKGLVSNPLNLTYSEVESFPMVSEVAALQCVYAPNGQPYNWTGVPLFYLLNLAGVQPGAKEVVFRAEDGFSSSITLDKAMHPTTILALKVNDTTLPYEDGYPGGLAGGYPYKVVVPCKYGYKWVGWIDEIEVVDYDYKGTYENVGYSDEASIPNCTQLPITIPAYTEFNATWGKTYPLIIFADATILDEGFNQTGKHVYFTISNDNSESLVYITIPKRLLTSDFTILSDNQPIQHSVIQSETNSFVYFNLDQGLHIVEIKGMLLADVTGPANEPDGIVNMLDLYKVANLFGAIKSSQRYSTQCDLNSDGVINMLDLYIVAQDFGKLVSQ